MTGRGTKLSIGAAGLILLWIAVYWWWEPQPAISFDAGGGGGGTTVSRSGPTPARTIDPGVTPPSYRTHLVSNGETWESIARYLWNDESMANVLRRANPQMSGGELAGGRTIRVPDDPTNIQGLPEPTLTRAPDPEPAIESPPPMPGEMRTYTIQPGDLLSRIAQSEYGSIRYTDFLFEHNRERLGLTSPDAIREGQMLELPPIEQAISGGGGND